MQEQEEEEEEIERGRKEGAFFKGIINSLNALVDIKIGRTFIIWSNLI